MVDMKSVDREKIRRFVLGLMHLSTFEEASGYRAWKGYDWDVLKELYEEGYVGNPMSKSRSVDLTAEGVRESKAIFEREFMYSKGLSEAVSENVRLRAQLMKATDQAKEAKDLNDRILELINEGFRCLDCHEPFRTLAECLDDECQCEGHCPYCNSGDWTSNP